MMKNLLALNTKQEILERINRLKSNSNPLWGKMNINQALRHMTLFFDIALGEFEPTIAKFLPLPKRILKFLMLNLSPPKSFPVPFKELDVVNSNVNPTDFEIEKNNLIQAIEKFSIAEVLISNHKAAGKFSKADWGKLAYNHTDHHLRQFGV
jgi:hypothetical protein